MFQYRTLLIYTVNLLLSVGYCNNLIFTMLYLQILKDFHNGISKFETLIWPIAVSIFSIGGMCGAFIGPHSARRVGR